MPYFEKQTKTWRAEITLGGKRYRKRGFTSKRNAALYETQLRRKYEMQLLDLPVVEKVEIQEIINNYMTYAREYKKPKAAKRDQSCLNIWQEFFKHHHVQFACEIKGDSPETFVEWRSNRITNRGKTPSKRTINLDLTTIKHVFLWAQEKKIVDKNPFDKMPLYKQKKPGLPRYLTTEEITTIEDACGTLIKKDKRLASFLPVFSVLIRTGMRSGEICVLEICNIDFERNQIILYPEQTKSSCMRTVPFPDKVKEILLKLVDEAKESKRQHVFYTNSGGKQTTDNINRRFRKVLNYLKEKSLIQNSDEIHTHTLRRSYISHMIMAGVDPVKVMEIVGHKDWETIRRYLVLSKEYLGKDREKLPY